MKFHILRIFTIFFTIVIVAASCTTQAAEPAQSVPQETDQTGGEQETIIKESPEPPASEEFVVTEEVYQETFEDIEALIERINIAVNAQNYDEWLTYLTDDYVDFWSDLDNLKKISDDLYKSTGYRVRLRNLKDYFTYVVVNSRIDIKLDKIEFIDENRITAESIIKDTPYILYYLERVDGEWKIGKW